MDKEPAKETGKSKENEREGTKSMRKCFKEEDSVIVFNSIQKMNKMSITKVYIRFVNMYLVNFLRDSLDCVAMLKGEKVKT